MSRTITSTILMIALLSALASAASITYQQNGNPLLTNGTNTTSATFLNADDSSYYNITAATIEGVTTQMLTNANFSTDDTGWVKTVGAVSTIAWYNSGQTGGSENVSISGSNKNNDNYIAQNVTAATKPSSGTMRWCYRVTVWTGGTASYLSVYLLSPGGSGLGTLLDNVSITGTTAWTCRSNSSISAAVLDDSGVYQFTTQAHLQTLPGASNTVSVLLDDFNLNFTTTNTYQLNVTHNSTANVFVPVNYTLQNVTTYISLKSNSTSPLYTLTWLYSGSYNSTGCSATTSIGASNTNLTCSVASSPSSVISGSAVSLRLTTDRGSVPFLLSEDFVSYVIRFPNMTSASISPSSNLSVNSTVAFQVNCSATADSDYPVTGASYNLQWRASGVGSFVNMDTNVSNGLYLNGSTPINPITGVTVPTGGSASQGWTVVPNLNGSYDIRCFVNSTTGGYQTSGSIQVNVTAAPSNVTLVSDSSEYEACGIVFYKVELFDSGGSYIDSPVNIKMLNTSLEIKDNIDVSTTGGKYFGSYTIPSSIDFGEWFIRGLASDVLGQASFIMGVGTSTLPREILITFTPDKILYNLNTDIQMNFTPMNQVGEKMLGLLPDRILVQIDSVNVTANVTESNGIYTYLHTSKLRGDHVTTVTVGGVTNSRAWSVR